MITLAQAIQRIGPADAGARRRAEARQRSLTKPPGSLGRLEEVSVQLAGIFAPEKPRIRGKAVIVAAADHGVVAQGVTGYPQAVTGQMVRNFLDGFISGAAALPARLLCPAARDYLIASHRSEERGHPAILSHLNLSPLLDLGMRLGEGSGAVLAMPIIEAASACLSGMATFDAAGVADRE